MASDKQLARVFMVAATFEVTSKLTLIVPRGALQPSMGEIF